MANILEITDFFVPELDIYARLTEKQLLCKAHPEKAVFVAESPLVISMAIDFGCKPISLLMEKKFIKTTAKDIITRCGEEVPIYTGDAELLKKLTGFHLTRGVLCAMERPKILKPAEICDHARRIAVLENVMNPTNIGAIFRSAAALNIDAVLLTHEGSDPLNRRAARVSMGTVFQIPWSYLPEGISVNDSLHNLGFKTAAMVLREDTLELFDPKLASEEKLAIVLGNEGDGLISKTISQCDYAVKIPMSHNVDSLNVATAGAIAFYQLALVNRKTDKD